MSSAAVMIGTLRVNTERSVLGKEAGGIYQGHSVVFAGPRSAIGRAPDSEVRGPGFDTPSGNILSFLFPLFQEGQLSVTGESMCTKY